MEKQRLKDLPLDQLKAEALRYGLPLSERRYVLIEIIAAPLESHGPVQDFVQNFNVPAARMIQEEHAESLIKVERPTEINPAQPDVVAMLAQTMDQMQLISAVNQNIVNLQQPPRPQRDFSPVSHSLATSERSATSSSSTANAVTLLTLQIPEFSGEPSKNVRWWIQRVEQMARAHRTTENITMLAASSKFTKIARKWYDSQTGAVLESWTSLRYSLIRMFDCRIPFLATMQKVEARKWQQTKELFQEYAIDKMSIIYSLNLSVQDAINLLIGGIISEALKAIAATIRMDSVDQFIEYRCQLVATVCHDEKSSAPSGKGPSGARQADRWRVRLCKNCGKKGHHHTYCRSAQVMCFFCKETGHRSFECPKSKRRDQTASMRNPTTSVAITQVRQTERSSVGDGTSAMDQVSSVLAISQQWKIPISDPYLVVVEISGMRCNLKALLDTGSPVSFIKSSLCGKLVQDSRLEEDRDVRRFNTLSSHAIDVLGVMRMSIRLSLTFELLLTVDFNVLKSNDFEYDVILGRDFLMDKLTLSFELSSELKDNCFGEFPRADIYAVSNVNPVEDAVIDFGSGVKNKLVKVFEEVEKFECPIAEDNYAVRVNLVDHSIYAYAPRKFAFQKRKQIRDIIDDLIARKIVKPSTSQYCARIVPVRKKDGSLRLCVDFRPLNERVAKQKFPFLLIKDCLARLGNHCVFTLLDLRDGFHQIKVHSSDTKYFSFATPDGQYEYTCLPFGFYRRFEYRGD
ncbi:uncharacterized protein LOC116847991 [Odontomachus brunneus]|uniref:uncharacterized protein LOC116847991 n=1 Tax=Odontomachus brunneus TaxID=486640 RepID=UPI0013F1C390|nr:uncharacterized protein LOC116847991 [Odontomachus brunneus]